VAIEVKELKMIMIQLIFCDTRMHLMIS